MHPEPAAINCKVEARAVFRRVPRSSKKEWAVEQLDENASVLDGLDGISDLHQLSCRGFRIGKGALLNEFPNHYLCARALMLME